MKRYIYLLTLLSFSCTNVQHNEAASDLDEKGAAGNKAEKGKTQRIDSLLFTTLCDTIPLSFMKTVEEQRSLLSFQRQTYFYCSPSVESEIMDSVPFNTKIRTSKQYYITPQSEHHGEIEERPASKRAKKWYKTFVHSKPAFVPEGRWAENILLSDVLFGMAPDLDHFLLVSFDSENDQRPLDSLKLHINHGHDIKKLLFNGLDFCKDVIRYYDYRTNCPGTSSTTFIGVNEQGGMKKIISSYHGTESDAVIYFPMKFENGKTLLVAGGNLDDIFSTYSGALNVMAYPTEIGVPINQLIIKVETEFAEDIEGLVSEEIEVERVDTTYYKWNGNELIEVKTTGRNT